MITYLNIILAILIGHYLINITIDLLNISNVTTSLPEEFADTYDAEKYQKSQRYLKDSTNFSIIEQTINLIITVGFIILGGFNVCDRIARSFEFNEIVTGLIFTGFLLLLQQILSLPFSIYSTFVIEKKYEFNKTTPQTFALDIIKGLLLTAIIGSIILCAIIWFFNSTGKFAWIYCWGFVIIFQIILLYIAPKFILPLFNKFTDLEDGDLKTAIKIYAEQENFHLKKIYKMDGSKRSTKSNAFFTGFGKNKTIALFDTLIDNHTTEELVAILAHEIGHYKMKHIIKNLVLSILTTGFMFYVLSLTINNVNLFNAFKMENLSVYASLIFFAFLYTPINFILSIVTNIISRKHEFEADKFAVNTYGHSENFINALKKLVVHNLSNLNPHPLKIFIDYSHPPVLNRIDAIKRISTQKEML